MSNNINPYRNTPLPAYQPTQRTPEAQAPQPNAPAERTQAPHTAHQPQRVTPGLSMEEQQMIDRLFPERPTLTLRLYGPGQGSKTLNPGALGSRIDLRG